jgi:hypothetical protein
MKPSMRHHMIAAGALAIVGAVGCTSSGTATTSTGYVYDDAYLYSTYYPADVAYASYYYAYPWDYNTFYYYLNAYGPTPTQNTGNQADAGTSNTGTGDAGTSNMVHSGLAFAIESLARGQQVCPNQVTVTEAQSAPACQSSNTAQQRAGAKIVFNNCSVAGGTINGTVEIVGHATASEPTCSAATTITLGHTATITNLSIKVADGRTLVIPNQTDTGMTTFTFGQSPTTTDIKSNGELKIMDSSGTTQADLSFMTDNAFTFSGTQSYKLDGTTTIQEKNGNATATITRQGLVRSQGCCRPTGGTITVDRTGGSNPGSANWSFGPSCGQIMRDGASVSMPTCM